MKVFYSESHSLHNPPFELFDGGQHMPYLENPDRMERILSVLRKQDWVEILAPEDFGLDPIIAVHDAGYVDFLRTAYGTCINLFFQVSSVSSPFVLKI